MEPMQIDVVEIAKQVMKKPPEDWYISRDFFRDFYKNYFLNDQDGWNKDNVDQVLKALQDVKGEKVKGTALTETLKEILKDNEAAIGIIDNMMDLVKICDRQSTKS